MNESRHIFCGIKRSNILDPYLLNLNSRHGKKQNESSFLSGTKSLGRAQGLQYLRQGDAARNSYDEDWDPESDAKATTLSRNNSGRGSIRSLPCHEPCSLQLFRSRN